MTRTRGDHAFTDDADGQAVLDEIADRLAAGKAVTCGFSAVFKGAPVVARHAYTVVDVIRNNRGVVTSAGTPTAPAATLRTSTPSAR